MTDAMGVYVGAMLFQKGLGLGRVCLFAFLMRYTPGQYGLWGVGMMVFTMAGRIMNVGVNQGVARYVSYYEARDQLEAFYRRIRWCIVALVAVTAAVAFAGSELVREYVVASRGEMAAVSYDEQMKICWLALANAAVMAVYQCLLAFMSGMRTYRLVSAMEVLFSVLLTVLGVAALMVDRSAAAVLVAHLGAVSISLVAGAVLLHGAVIRATSDRESGEPRERKPAPGAFAHVLRFGAVAMFATLVWSAAQFVGFYIVSREFGKAAAAPFMLMMQLTLPVLFLANAAWAVLFSHVAKRWEDGDPQGAVAQLQTAYKTIAMGAMTLTVALYATSGLWMRVLPSQYAKGQALLGGLFLLFQAMTQLSIVTILAKLQKRPMVTGLLSLGAVALNVVLALRWMAAGGIPAVAWAGGIAMYAGGGLVGVAYLLLSPVRFRASTYFVLATPILLVLPEWTPMWAMPAAWGAVLVAAVATPWLFDREQKRLIASAAARLAGNLRGMLSWR